MSERMQEVRVSVLMPTYRHATFILRALESLLAQQFQDWELLIVDDGSPDDTAEVVAPLLHDQRIHYQRLPCNRGIGAALNEATSQARGKYLAYLPSDDLYYPDHLQRLVDVLDTQQDVYVAYGGLRWNRRVDAPTLQGEAAVGNEAEWLEREILSPEGTPLLGGNLLAPVQVMHRRTLEGRVRWTPRAQVVSDTLERDFWRALVQHGAGFRWTGAITCEWVDHAAQYHKLMNSLSQFRMYYDLPDEWLNWQPTRGICVNEPERYGRFAVKRALPTPGGLTILVVGELGFNPDRLMAFEEAGHKLIGLWIPAAEGWNTTGPFPWGNIDYIPYTNGWQDAVRAAQPDVIYGALNIHAVRLLHEVLEARFELPFVFHFKESAFIALEHGTWPLLMRLLRESDGQIHINREVFEWFQLVANGTFDPATTMILDGDLPKADYFTDDWMPKLSSQDGEIHTVCSGRPLGLDPFADIAAAGIHVHFYGKHFQQWFPTWTSQGLPTGYMHLHPTVEPQHWVSELSQYDAAWHHIFTSRNGGDLRRADWDDLNLPARIGTYAAAGLPWILRDNRQSRVALQRVAQDYDVGIFFTDYHDLARQLRDSDRMAELTLHMREARRYFAWDTYMDDLIAFFRRAIERHRIRRGR